MTAAQWQRAREIFDAALDMLPGERAHFLEHACAADSSLLAEVEGLLQADEEAGAFLESPVLPQMLPPREVALLPGDVVSGRFRIVRPLGDGGMGQVYEALDSELGVRVALKTLRPEVASNPEVLHRFKQEVRIAHRITHPNVCRTFHLDRELRPASPDNPSLIDLTFLTMEYLDGETVQQILRREGSFTPGRTLEIARQMAHALEAAHQTGIIHRDIKPGNVMICPSAPAQPERVVVTDFGLAKLAASSPASGDFSSISVPGRAMGTLSYMSPEQLEARDVGPPADIYAFGLVLFEMLTGQKAFPDSGTLAAAYRRLTDDPPSPLALDASLPIEWEHAILGCLQIDPTARFQHASDVIAVLEGVAPPLPIAPAVAALRQAARRSRRRKRLALLAALLGCMALSVVAFRLYEVRANSTVAPGTLVYLAPVGNTTGEKQMDNVAELMQASLGQSAQITLLDPARVSDTLQLMAKTPDAPIDPATAREVSMRTGARRVIFALVSSAPDRYKLSVDLQQTDNTPFSYRHDWKNSFTWPRNPSASSGTISPEMLSAIRDASTWIRSTVGESAGDVARLDVPPEDVTTTSWEALGEYAQAQRLASRGDQQAAVLALRNAVRLDPGFALAYARLGDILVAIQQPEEGIAAYLKALDSGSGRRLSRRERDRIKAMYAIDTGDYEGADLALRDSISFYEDDPLSWAYRVNPLKMLGRPEEAIVALQKVLAINPRSEFGLGETANTLMFMGKLDQAEQAIAQVRAAGYTDLASNLEVQLRFLQGRLPEAEAAAHALASARSADLRLKSLPLLARLSAERGAFAPALAYLDQAIGTPDVRSRTGFLSKLLLDRATLRSRLIAGGQLDFVAMRADLAEAMSLSPSPPNRIAASAILGQAIPEAPSPSRKTLLLALDELSHQPAGPAGIASDLANLRVQGEVRLAAGDAQAALALFRKAAALDAPAGSRDYLARAITAAAAREKDPAAVRQLQEQALDAYATIALKPGFVWHDPLSYPPGFFADQLQEFVHLGAEVHSSRPQFTAARTELQRLRGSSAIAAQKR